MTTNGAKIPPNPSENMDFTPANIKRKRRKNKPPLEPNKGSTTPLIYKLAYGNDSTSSSVSESAHRNKIGRSSATASRASQVSLNHSRLTAASSSLTNRHSTPESSPIRTSRRITSPTSQPPTANDSSQPPQLHAVMVSGLPDHARTPRGIFAYLRRIQDLFVCSVNPTRNGSIIIRSTDPKLALKLVKLRSIISTEVEVQKLDPRRPPPTNQKPRDFPFSCVITRVPLDVPIDEVKEHLNANGIHYKNSWRIISRQTNNRTTLIRVLTSTQQSLVKLLSQGIVMYNFKHRVERSKPTGFQPFQCMTCLQFHEAGNCKQKTLCLHCGKQHHVRQCPSLQEPAKCSNCKQNHVATS